MRLMVFWFFLVKICLFWLYLLKAGKLGESANGRRRFFLGKKHLLGAR